LSDRGLIPGNRVQTASGTRPAFYEMGTGGKAAEA